MPLKPTLDVKLKLLSIDRYEKSPRMAAKQLQDVYNFSKYVVHCTSSLKVIIYQGFMEKPEFPRL